MIEAESNLASSRNLLQVQWRLIVEGMLYRMRVGFPWRDLRTAQDRIVDWWQSAYLSDGMPVGKVRFYNEAQSALPLLDQLTQPEDVIDAMQLHRERLKQDQQLSDWVR